MDGAALEQQKREEEPGKPACLHSWLLCFNLRPSWMFFALVRCCFAFCLLSGCCISLAAYGAAQSITTLERFILTKPPPTPPPSPPSLLLTLLVLLILLLQCFSFGHSNQYTLAGMGCSVCLILFACSFLSSASARWWTSAQQVEQRSSANSSTAARTISSILQGWRLKIHNPLSGLTHPSPTQQCCTSPGQMRLLVQGQVFQARRLSSELLELWFRDSGSLSLSGPT